MRREIKGISLAIGKSCFMHCSGCYNHFSVGEVISKDDIINFVKFVQNTHKVEKVTLCGGDPLSREDIFDILRELKNLGLKIHLDTTGVPLVTDARIIFYGRGTIKKMELAPIVDNVDLLGLPMDGPNNEVSEMFRKGRSNYIDEVIELIDNLARYNLDICINTVVHKNNLKYLSAIANVLVTKQNVVKWQLFQFIPTGPIGYNNAEQYYITSDSYKQGMEKLNKYVQKIEATFEFEPKAADDRKNIYILVDSAGDVWCPRTSLGTNKWNVEQDSTKERVVFGNIAHYTELEKIVNEAYDYQGE